MTPDQKILAFDEAASWIETERAARHHIGFTCGAFDIMHAGHAQYLSEAKALCDRLLVAVNSDESIQRYKNPLRPVNPWKERAFVVASLESVDRVTILEEERPLELIVQWRPDLYIKGGDYVSSSLQSAAAVEAYGGRTVVIPSRFDASTTAMFERIQTLAIHAVPQQAPNVAPRGLILLDRDGTLVRDACFDPLKIELLPGVIEALRMLQSAGFRLCIVSNQQGIGLGYYGYREFIDGNRKLLRMLGKAGITISKIYFCPHSEADRCACRKPAPGMILRAMREQNVPPARCFMIGDSERDLEAARTAGCRGVIPGPSGIAEAAREIVEAPD